MWKTIFLIDKKIKEDGTWEWDIDACLSTDWEAVRADITLCALDDRKSRKFLDLRHALNGLSLRVRFNASRDMRGPFMINTPDEFTRDSLGHYVKSFPPNQLLESLKNGKISLS